MSTEHEFIKSPARGKPLSEEKLFSWIVKQSRNVYVPSAVYRFQFNREFTFKRAAALVPYLKSLGIDAVYCSPFLQAVPGSMHGYDVADPTRLNAEVGTLEDYRDLCRVLKQHGLGQIADVVPNHMGISGNNNKWWTDVLENGHSSVYASYFDIAWESAKSELKGKILLPVLGDLYGRVLENQELQLVFEKGSFWVLYYERRFPVDPQTYPVILGLNLSQLKKSMGDNNPDLREYLSIITSLNNLSINTEIDPDKAVERRREKEIAKSRLSALCDRSVVITSFIAGLLVVFNGKKGDPRSFDNLDNLLDLQAYRMGLWSVAAQEINYRRFFNINDLAAICTENEQVFRHYHALLFDLIREGKISGLRIDHPDGLYDPPAYFRMLQRECLLQKILGEWDECAATAKGPLESIDQEKVRNTLDKLLMDDFASAPGFYVVAEKILDRKEPLPDDWMVHGTVGYEFLNAVNGLFIDKRNEAAFSALYDAYIGYTIDFSHLVYAKKKFFALVHMASEINTLGSRLDRISETDRMFRDFTRNDLTLAIREVIACFPVYRTYVSPESLVPSERDVEYITEAVEKAKSMTPALNSAVYDFLKDVLLLRVCCETGGEEGRLYKDFLLRFQQLTGPIMAKGMEDTSFYVYNRLISLNEVGGDPLHFGCATQDFHLNNTNRNQRWPGCFLASSTHDTKRSEDVRQRINVLSECPAEWDKHIKEWAVYNDHYKTTIDGLPEPRRNTEYYLYQTLLGVWPDVTLLDKDYPAFIERIWPVILKSIREAKIHTSWIRPDLAYEGAVKNFTTLILTPGSGNAFLKSFLNFQQKISFYGKCNGLSSALLRIASPGVVDMYQGDEIWNYCLVDPDNRGDVDYEKRKNALATFDKALSSGKSWEDLLATWRKSDADTLKVGLLSRWLRYRREHKDVFVGGDYFSVSGDGDKARHVVSFARSRGAKVVLAVAARFFMELVPNPHESMPNPSLWLKTRLILPAEVSWPQELVDVVTGHRVRVHKEGKVLFVKLEDVFKHGYTGLLEAYEKK